mgnify:CR=1 FL=1
MNTNCFKLVSFIVVVLMFSCFSQGKSHSSKRKNSSTKGEWVDNPKSAPLDEWFRQKFGNTPGYEEYGDEWADAIGTNLEVADYEKMLEAILNDSKTPQLYYAFVQKYYRPYFEGLEPAELIKLRPKALTKSTLLKVLKHHAGLSVYLPERKQIGRAHV